MASQHELLVPPTLWETIRGDLLSTPDLERAAVAFSGQVTRGSGKRLLLRDWAPVPADDYLVQLGSHLEVTPAFWARATKRARLTGEALVVLHSHPRDPDIPRFSGSDNQGENQLIPKIHARAQVPVAAVVVSPAGQSARVTSPQGQRHPLSITTLGAAPPPSDTPFDPRYERQVQALGKAGQATLNRMTVGVVGAGGLGSHVIQQLLHLGVGDIVVVDHDRVARSNLSRLVGATWSDAFWKRRKTTVSKRLARRTRRAAKVVAVPRSVTRSGGAAPLLNCDIIIGCTDNQWSRTVLNRLAYQYYIPVLDLGVELQTQGAMGGRVTWLAPGSACLWCLGILDPDRVRIEQLPAATRQEEAARGYIQGLDEPAPAVVSINGVIASLAVTELLARKTGFAGPNRPNLLMYRLNDGVVRRSNTPSRDGCPTCTTTGTMGAGQLTTPPWDP
jgi:molybdopterin/thiamine biosynthesis adenylyltransferase